MFGQNEGFLALDAGNSRLKWMYRAGADESVGVCDYGEFGSVSLLQKIKCENPSRIVVSSVKPEAFNRQLAERCVAAWGVKPVFAHVEKNCLGVTAGYENLAHLGVDRWLAMLAAFSANEQACVVVDAGTAITVDFVESRGRHIGGLIVPGIQASARALFRDTHAVSPESLTLAQKWQPGCDTLSCVEQGVSASLQGLLAQIEGFSLQMGSDVKLYLTGGDAAVLQPWLGGSIKSPELVLEGALLWLKQL
ncbi:type III pantothenate kinase [Alteromonadaceae bacterium Bs31]|nr:type III pantothenate kinase [Alteromonadaceae bacterium Bs31]